MNLNQMLKSTTTFQEFKNHPQLEQAWLAEQNKKPKEVKTLTPYDVLKDMAPFTLANLSSKLVKIENGVAYAALKNDILVAFPATAPDGVYDIEYDLKAKNITFKTPHKDDIYYTPLPETPHSITTDLAWLAPAMSTEETRYYLNGVYIDNTKAVATDGHRLHLSPLKTDSPINVIIPRPLVALAVKHKVKTVNIGESYSAFTASGFTFYAKNIDGNYPDYTKAIPQYNNKTITIKNKIPKLKGWIAINEAGETFTYTYKGKDRNVLHGESFEPTIGFSSEYFSLYGDCVTFKYEDARTPVIIEQGSNMAILMPVRL